MSQTDLVKRCQLGDANSFEELYHLHKRKAMGTAYLMAGHKGIAEDIVQEAFAQCFSKINQIKTPETFDIWFYKLLVRIGWKMAAKYSCTVPMEGLADSQLFAVDSQDTNEVRLSIREALKKLKEPYKTTVVLYYLNGMSVGEISKVLGCFQGTIKSRLHQARKLLHRELQDHTDPDALRLMY